MPHIVRDIGWGTIDIVEHQSRVFFQQRWKYSWQETPPLKPWSLAEKRAFHADVDRQVWASWSNRVQLSVSGTSAFARRFSGRRLPMNLDVRWVRANEQWNVTAWKSTVFQRGSVNWAGRRVTLYTSDMRARRACTSAALRVCTSGFRTVPHEFGHAVGNSGALGRGDEYNAGSVHLADTTSIMNIGRELRRRHFRTILDEMNRMIPNTTFAVAQIN
ncbi:MAG: hypothetical protein ABGZ17_01645 [Planctomycetaceae bacterium]